MNWVYSFFKGKNGEKEVIKKLKMHLDKSSNNYYLLSNVALKDISSSKDIDVLLVHPIFGIFIIEVKNYKKIDEIALKNPFKQANEYQDMMLTLINSKLGNVINIDYKVAFPSISKYEAIEYMKNSGYGAYINHSIFKEDLEDLSEFFKTTNNKVPSKEEFLKIVSLLVPKPEQKDDIVPILTKDEVLFFDYKQLSVLNGYRSGLRVIRGVAGTGKTIILINFIKNILREEKKKFLVLCFNKKLANNLKKELKSQNVEVYSLFELLKEIGFNFEGKIVGKCPKCEGELIVRKGKYGEFISCKNFPNCKYNAKLTPDKKYLILENEVDELMEKFKKFQRKKQFDYFLSDETQDFPAVFTRIIIENIKNSILFIDEAQKIYPYTMDSIRDVLWHPKFGKYPHGGGNFRNLYNVYRTPSNISKCAFEILSLDKNIGKYYKSVNFIKNDFVDDIKFVLEEGEFLVDNFNDLDELKELVDKIKGDKLILSFKNDDVEEIERKLKLQAMPMASVKGLEAENVIIHNFEEFLNVASKNDIFYRQVYVLLTRSKKNIYISINEKELIRNEKIDNILNVLNSYSNSVIEEIAHSKVENNTKLIEKIDKEKLDLGKNVLIAGLEIFGAMAGFFNL